MRLSCVFCVLLLCASPCFADDSAAKRWEKALKEDHKEGKWPGPKPGQKCLWSKPLKRCLWYTPGVLDDYSNIRKQFGPVRVHPRNWQTMVPDYGMYGAGFFRLPL